MNGAGRWARPLAPDSGWAVRVSSLTSVAAASPAAAAPAGGPAKMILCPPSAEPPRGKPCQRLQVREPASSGATGLPLQRSPGEGRRFPPPRTRPRQPCSAQGAPAGGRAEAMGARGGRGNLARISLPAAPLALAPTQVVLPGRRRRGCERSQPEPPLDRPAPPARAANQTCFSRSLLAVRRSRRQGAQQLWRPQLGPAGRDNGPGPRREG